VETGEIILDERTQKYADTLAELIRMDTTSYDEQPDKTVFYRFHDMLKEKFPHIFSAAEYEDFSGSFFRVYTNTDVKGIEICGAMKNIIALAAGINNGMGLGDNSKAMLMTRGIAEITRLGAAMGCKAGTFMGLAGIGDLIVTCTSRHSRNNRCGELIGQGLSYLEARDRIGMVVEGYHALSAAMELSKKYNVELPITEAVYRVIMDGLSPKDAMLALMTRDLKSELEN
jgi:glycerol-3-phosphate dehydrogenase (NAD(P)+)